MTCFPDPEKAERLIVGYTTKDHLILDLDRSRSLPKTAKLVRMIQRDYSDVGDCLLAKSSDRGFHSVFDSKLSWNRIMQICRTLAGLGIVNRDYIAIRTFREDLTLRVSSVDRGYKKSSAPLPVMIIATRHDLFLPGRTLSALPIEVKIRSILEFQPKPFSGIANYLRVLSTFRQLEQVSIPIA